MLTSCASGYGFYICLLHYIWTKFEWEDKTYLMCLTSSTIER